MAKGDDIQERLIDFAVRVVRLCGSLPKTQSARHVSGQLLRSGTAPAAHYADARGAESSRDFVHKLRICLKELNESNIWLQIIQRSDMILSTLLNELIRECGELSRIINASIRTASERRS